MPRYANTLGPPYTNTNISQVKCGSEAEVLLNPSPWSVTAARSLAGSQCPYIREADEDPQQTLVAVAEASVSGLGTRQLDKFSSLGKAGLVVDRDRLCTHQLDHFIAGFEACRHEVDVVSGNVS